MKLTSLEYDAILNRSAIKRANPDSSQSSYPIPQCPAVYKSVPQAGDERSDSAKLLIRVKSFRRRLLDEDNLVEKWHVDALRYAGIVPSDAPDKAKIEVSQEKVKTKEEECTVITIERIGSP